jgi:predicted enzyme related to lactoylglutathione lyase
MHRSRVCHFVIDVPDLDHGTAFWKAALGATEETLPETSRPIYRSLILPDSPTRVLLQKTSDPKTGKERMHLDIETDDIDAELTRLEALGATRWDHQAERGWEFWVLRDPWGNEFCVLPPLFPDLLAEREPWDDRAASLPSRDAACAALLSICLARLAGQPRQHPVQPRWRAGDRGRASTARLSG